jgi:choline transport protein
MWTYLLNAAMGFVVLIAFIFCIPDVDAAINDESGFPLIYVLNLSMSTRGTLGMFILFFILILVGGISYQASTARQTFAFARDQGLPFSGWIGKVLCIFHKFNSFD